MRYFVRIPILLLCVLMLGSALPVWHTNAAPSNVPRTAGRFVVFEAFMRLG
jgi:hypothetical protein